MTRIECDLNECIYNERQEPEEYCECTRKYILIRGSETIRKKALCNYFTTEEIDRQS